jgi:hypothetical protein
MADDVDEALEETFPASDPPANTPETGIRLNGDPLEEETATKNPETTETEGTETTDSHRETK